MEIDPAALAALPYELRAEIAENLCRKDFLPSEIDAARRKCEAALQAQAKERQGTRTDQHPGKLPEGCKGDTRDKIAALVGVSGRTVDKIADVCDAAREDPDRFTHLVEEMDRTERVDGVYKKLVVTRKADAILKEPPPLPGRGPYRVIVADPPWAYEYDLVPYPTMSIAEICALPVADIVHGDSILWLWTTNAHMAEAFKVVSAWGFAQRTILTWDKARLGMGTWLRGQTEHCLVAVRGSPVVTLTNQRTLLRAPARQHSQKPDAFYTLVESLCPAPRYAELFQRTIRQGWDGHGDEVRVDIRSKCVEGR